MSVVPENTDPGTAKDTDLVFAAEDPRMVCYYGRILPPKEFRGFNNSTLEVPLMYVREYGYSGSGRIVKCGSVKV